jgi:hypothetical protein
VFNFLFCFLDGVQQIAVDLFAVQEVADELSDGLDSGLFLYFVEGGLSFLVFGHDPLHLIPQHCSE